MRIQTTNYCNDLRMSTMLTAIITMTMIISLLSLCSSLLMLITTLTTIMTSTFHDNFPQLALAVLLLISPRPLSHGRPGSWAPVQVIRMTTMVMMMMMMMMMMVRTNRYICKKLFQAWLAALSPNVTLIKMMMTLMLMVNMMTQPTNKQKYFQNKTVSGLV